MIEVKFKMSYEDLMENYLFGPLRMKARFTPSLHSAVGHSVVEPQYSSTWYMWWYKTIFIARANITAARNKKK